MRPTRRLTVGVAALALMPLAGCGGKPAGCTSVDQSVAQAIVDGANGSGLQVYRSSGKAIQAPSGAYYVALKVKAADEDATGVWAVDSLTAPAGIRSVDGFAHQFTDWPQLEGANGSDRMRDAVACLDD